MQARTASLRLGRTRHVLVLPLCLTSASCASDPAGENANVASTTSSVTSSSTSGGTGSSTAPDSVTSATSATSATTSSTSSTTGGGPPTEPVGLFSIELTPENPATQNPAFTAFQGAVRDAPVNETIIWEPALQVGNCQLFTPRFPFCETPCGSAAACVEDGVCTPHPARVSVGTVSVRGVLLSDGGSEFSLDPIGANFNYLTGASVVLAYPPFLEAANVELSAAGGAYEPFSISISGIAELVVGGENPLPFVPAEPLSLSWTRANQGNSVIDVLVDISHHGGVKGKIECRLEDNGSYMIDATLVTQLIDLGVAGFPVVKLSRRSRGSAQIAVGRVDFEAVAHVERPLSIPGLVSCSTAADCDEGQTCLQNRTCG